MRAVAFASVLIPQLLVVFFSSRRRHTRLVSDWSSDVCSSDLVGLPWSYNTYRDKHFRNFRTVEPGVLYRSGQMSLVGRSEERRVGKECRPAWGPGGGQRTGTSEAGTCGVARRTRDGSAARPGG